MTVPLRERVPPQSLEAEQATLGSMLTERIAISRVRGMLRPEDFYNPQHEMLYRAMIDLYDQDKPVDLVLLQSALQDREQLEKIGGAPYLLALQDAAPTAASVEDYAGIVVEKAQLRELLSAARELRGEVHREGAKADEVCSRMAERLLRIGRHRAGAFEQFHEAGVRVQQEIAEQQADGKHLLGIDTYIPSLNAAMPGWGPASYNLVAARPGWGKSAFALQQAWQAAEDGKSVAYFSLEMNASQIIRRYLARTMELDLDLVMQGKVGDLTGVAEAIGLTAGWNFNLCCRSDISITQLQSEVRTLAACQGGLDLLVVDYLGLVRSDRPGSRNDEMSQISAGVKAIAQEIGPSVLALSQLNRQCEIEQRWPRLSDLRDSGTLEQDADTVLFLYFPDWDKQFDRNTRGLYLAKQRNGRRARMWMAWHGAYQRFAGLDNAHVSEDE